MVQQLSSPNSVLESSSRKRIFSVSSAPGATPSLAKAICSPSRHVYPGGSLSVIVVVSSWICIFYSLGVWLCQLLIS
eukprot:14057701-Ditylum_brightwellii.AAC.1